MILHEVLTTEKVPFSYRVAGLGSRLLAWLVDLGFLVLLGFLGYLMGMVLEMGRPGLGVALILLWQFVLMWAYFLLFEWLWQGQTPGKRLVGLRVIQWRGTAISFYQSAVRNVLRMVDFLPGGYGLGVAVAACNREGRRLGDLAADTLVVHVERRRPPLQALAEGQGEIEHARLAQARQRLGQLSREQKQTLLDLCLRREQLRFTERARLFQAAGQYLEANLELAPLEHESPEKFVARLARILAEIT
jgi:uncharacterized RDD family membrane protein YckC